MPRPLYEHFKLRSFAQHGVVVGQWALRFWYHRSIIPSLCTWHLHLKFWDQNCGLERIECVGYLQFLSFPNPLTAEWALRALIEFTLSNARRFYSSMRNPLDGKGLSGNEKGLISGLIIEPHNNQLPVDRIAQLVEYYTGIAKAWARMPVCAWVFHAFLVTK